MKANVEDISPVKKRVLIEVDSDEVDKKLEKAYREVGKKAKIRGFRPGKVPRTILERHFGNQVADDVSNDLINETFPRALKELEAFPLGIPSLEKEPLKKGANFKYSAVMEVRPKFELGEYKGVEVEKEKRDVADEDVASRLEQIRKANGKLESVEEDRPIRQDDYAVLNYEAYEGEAPIEGLKAENFLLRVGSNDFHHQFEEGLIGLKKGDEKEITVDFEESFYHARLAGKTVRFHVKVADVKEMALPELNDDFAKGLGSEFESLENLRQKVREAIEAEEEKRIDRDAKGKLMEKVSAGVDFELPEVLVQSEIDSSLQNIRQNLLRSGSNLEKAGMSEAKLREDLREPAEKRAKEMLILSEIAKKEGLEVSEEDVAEGFEKLASATGQDSEVLRKYYEARDLMDSLRQSLLEEKTLNYLLEHANIKEVEKA